jgi:hypothetical protein
MPPSTTTTTTGGTDTATTYDNVLDTARRVAELEHQRAQDALYIRTLEQTRATLMRDAQSAARARGEVARAVEGEREAQRGRAEAEAVRDEAVRMVRVERERAERAEVRVRALEGALGVAERRVGELEVEVEGRGGGGRSWRVGLRRRSLRVLRRDATLFPLRLSIPVIAQGCLARFNCV